MFISYVNTPFGRATMRASDIGLTELSFSTDKKSETPNTNEHIQLCTQELQEYFDGSLSTFSTPIDMSFGPPFHQKVWKELLNIPFGETRSYLDIAVKLGDRNAVRAVGTANGKNPIAIIVPCHRVIGSNGSLTGYAYGLDMKQRLLMIENPDVFGIQQQLFT